MRWRKKVLQSVAKLSHVSRITSFSAMHSHKTFHPSSGLSASGKGRSGEAGTWEEKVAFLEAELERAKSREDLYRLQIEETRSKAGQAFAFQVELAQQQEETLEEYHKRELTMLAELEAAKKEAGRAGELEARLDGQ